MSTNKRSFTRIDFDAECSLISDKKQWHTQLADISLKGALLIKPKNWTSDVGDEYTLSLKLDNTELKIEMLTSVSHFDEEHIGLTCKQIDLDSISTLRRLVEINIGDDQLLGRELAALGK